MHDVFICHSEQDHAAALEIAAALEALGYTTWYYERDSLPGESHLIQVGRAIDEARCVLLLASRGALASSEVTAEVVRAYEARVPFVPLLLDVTHREVRELHPVWRQALVTSTTLAIPPEGLESVLPRVVRGMENLGVRPAPAQPEEVDRPAASLAGEPPAQAEEGPVRPALEARAGRARRLAWGVPAVLAAAVALWLGLRGGSTPGNDAGGVTEPPAGAAATGGPSMSSPAIQQPIRPETTPARRAAESETGEPGPSVPPAAESAPSPPPADLALLIDEETGEAGEILARALRGARLSVTDPRSTSTEPTGSRPRQAAARPPGERETLLRGDAASRARLLSELGARAALVGEARTYEVAQGFGLLAMRAEVSVEWVSADAPGIAGLWTVTEKATGASREAARRAALEAAVEELIGQMRAAGRMP